MKYDIIVAGAGTGGSLAAMTAAKLGLKTLVVEGKPKEKIGEKICGDAIGKHHFDHIGIPVPKGDELERKIDGIEVFSPDRETVFTVGGHGLDGFIINRNLFGIRLVNMALDAGAELLDRAVVREPIIKDNYVVGLRIRHDNQIKELYADVIVEATGMSAIIRRKLPDEFGIEREIAREDIANNYREIRELTEEIERPQYAKIYLTQDAAPGGYVWVFPKRGTVVNTGLGVQWKKGSPHPKKQFEEKVLKKWDIFKDSKFITGGGATVTTRRPLDMMVANGLILVGDAAAQVNPVHGGGIGSSMLGGKLAAEVAAEAIEKGDVSRNGLWDYNKRFNQEYGAKQASLDVFRVFLQTLKDDDLSYGMKAQLITEDDLLKANLGEDLRLNITEKAKRLLKGIRKLDLLKNLQYTAAKMKEAKQLYLNYPDVENYENWLNNVHKLFLEVRKKFWGY